MTNEELTILIENYLDGELSEQERQQFEQDLKTDKELAKELELHKIIREVVSDKEMADLREKLDIIRKEYHEKEEIKRKRKKIAVYSSGFLITILLITTLFLCNRSYTNDEVFNMYYEHYDAGTVTRGEVKPTTEIFTNALRIYDNGQYIQSIEQFNQLTDTSTFYTSKEFFTALSYMELKNYAEAIRHFETALSDKQNIYHDSATWYCGLCYLKTNKTEKAKQKFQSLNGSCPLYQKKSLEILEKIK